jgi:hypothetical protein
MTRHAARSLTAIGAALCAVLLLSSCTDHSGTSTFKDPAVPLGSLKLVAFDSCANLLDGLRPAARSAVGPWGFGGGRMIALEGGPGGAKVAAPNAAVPDAAAAASGSGTYSGTNTHEVGVDEPDLVKTDGKRIVTVTGGILRIVDAASRRVSGVLDVSSDGAQSKAYGMTELLLAGDHALVLGQRYGTDDQSIAGPSLTLVDLTSPRILGRYAIDGTLVDARQVGATARVVVRSAPRLRFPRTPVGTDSARTDANKRVIDSAPVDDWLPRFSTVDSTGKTSTGRVDCTAVSRPAEYSGTSTVTVLSFDLGATGLGSGDPVTLVADGDTIYANGPSLYIASDQRWRVMLGMQRVGGPNVVAPVPPKTQLYKFDISGGGKPRFTGSGEVDGWLLSQYALSEWDGRLRVATTLGQPWDRTGSTESTVYVLRQNGRQLAQMGKVGGLGKGERIYAVRFIGTTGYVVTFRQTDPLYVIDLRNPAAPTVTGELKISGYSAYLHPAGDGRLIGIGQDANAQGRTQGTQVSLFDVHDVANPARLAQFQVSGGHSEAEFDPHAFLYWPQGPSTSTNGVLVVPLSSYNQDQTTQGALVLSVHDRTLTRVGTVTHPTNQLTNGVLSIRRSLIIDSTLWTFSDAGLKANTIGTLAETAWLPFG